MGLGSILGSVINELTNNEEQDELVDDEQDELVDDDTEDAEDDASDSETGVVSARANSVNKSKSTGKAAAFKPIQDTSDKPKKPSAQTPPPQSASESVAPEKSKPKVLSFGDALAEGLPKSWSILPPDAGVIKKRIIQ